MDDSGYAGKLPSLNALRAFESASRHLNFRLAGDELGVTSGAIAQHVRGLEAALRVTLFERRARTLALTESGRQYAASVRRAFDLLTDATQTLRPQPLQLTISVTPTFAAKWLIPRLPAFTQACPDIDLRIVATEQLSHFQHDAVDIAVRYGRPPFGAGLVADSLFDDVRVAVCSPATYAEFGGFAAPDALARATLLHDAHDDWPHFIGETLGESALPATRNIRFNQTSLAIDAALAGQGLALAQRAFVETELATGQLVRAFAAEMRTSAGFYLVHPRKARHAGPLAIVKAWLREHAS